MEFWLIDGFGFVKRWRRTETEEERAIDWLIDWLFWCLRKVRVHDTYVPDAATTTVHLLHFAIQTFTLYSSSYFLRSDTTKRCACLTGTILFIQFLV